MAMKRTTVMVDEEDLRLVKLAAEREGRPEAELIRRAFHLVAMSTRTWDEPFFEETLDLGGPVRENEIRQGVDDAVNRRRGSGEDAA
ncbi:ribbon-helix-helix protein, CopG family [Streptomyces sp. RKND-216]|uniref:ribbon-helix-helix protein, CopG family n=1 Tax=Streptomyces sp. RKND-216 TaxID=2562581 RepID=UPI00109E1004|nr:ribbon-helix-helix protein, CopG family [Streptomyces sp. RKND-216]THA24402.1 ribbon-helix-helix protein, CopG family [Streptomyces sp. RKND-216]